MTTEIQSLGMVALTCQEAGVYTSFLSVWHNPNNPGPDLDDVVRACVDIRSDLDVTLKKAGWTTLPPPYQPKKIQLSDFTWDGVCVLPDLAEFRNLDNTDIVKIPGREAVWLQGHQGIREVALPEFVATKNLSEMNVCGVDTFTLLHGGTLLKPETTIGSGYRLGAFTELAGELVTASYEFYNVAGRDHSGIVFVPDILNQGVAATFAENRGRPGPKGVSWRCADVPGVNCNAWFNPADLEIYHYNKTTGDHLCAIDRLYADGSLGGRRLGKGRHRGAGAFGGNNGPCLYAGYTQTQPDGTLGDIPLLCYPTGSGTWPGYRKAEKGYYSQWIHDPVNGRRALLVGAMRGRGPNYYGPGPSCNSDKGWHAEPYEPEWYLFDTDDLAKVAAGTLNPWDPKPYDTGDPRWVMRHPADPGEDPNCRWSWFSGMHFDVANQKLYVVQPKIRDGGINKRRTVIERLSLV